jgi:hypothetical protein
MVLMRYADDIVVGFEHEADARRFWEHMRARLEEFSLSLHPDKTRLIEFGRFALGSPRRDRGRPSPTMLDCPACPHSPAKPNTRARTHMEPLGLLAWPI